MEAIPSAQIQRLMVTENSINTVHYKHSRNVKPTTKVAVTHIANGDFHQVLTTCHQMLLRSIHLDRHTLLRVLSAYRPISLSASNSMASGEATGMKKMEERGWRDERRKSGYSTTMGKNERKRLLPIQPWADRRESGYSATTLPSANPGFAIVHGHAHKLVCSANRYGVATLIELYGHLDGADAAKGLFDKYPQHPLLRALFLGLCWQGCTLGKVIKPGKAVHVFGRMMESGAQIGSVAVATAAGACGMLRSLIDGTKVHRVGKEGGLEYELHRAWLVALLSRSGQFDDARSFIAEKRLKGMPRYAENVKQEMVDEVRGMITDMDLRPNKPYTWTELENKIHAFGTGDVAHRRSQGIGLELQCLMQKMEGKGQRPESDFSFRDVDEERGCWPFLLASSVHNPGAS
ncbi:putative pentatricopeptide repeat-containing protein At3g49142 [Pyrus communis]|uniref:putative pentatricopeptide repeat-containing protein At3g49142 n=1 Tax=Pyrus communis TaxID=23211 RepID=UPI0035C14E40